MRAQPIVTKFFSNIGKTAAFSHTSFHSSSISEADVVEISNRVCRSVDNSTLSKASAIVEQEPFMRHTKTVINAMREAFERSLDKIIKQNSEHTAVTQATHYSRL